MVGGGDGTLSCAAGLVAGTGLPLGILPLGTLNHFAKDLAIPLDLEKAAGVIAAGHVRRVDVGEGQRPRLRQQLVGRHLPLPRCRA